MKRKTLLLICTSVFTSTLFVTTLYLTAFDFTSQRGSFLRKFVGHVLFNRDTIDLKYNSYYFAGATHNNIYFGNHQVPRHMVKFNLATADTQHIILTIKGLDFTKVYYCQVSVDSPYFYFMTGSVPALFRGEIGKWTASRYMYDSTYFNKAIPISNSSIALRTISRKTNDFALGKQQQADTPHVFLNHDLLVKQVDGRFCVDGHLAFNKNAGRIAYTYYYRNQFMIMDTSLNLLFKGNTIDTISQAKINVATIDSEESKALDGLPPLVNIRSFLSDDFLFVHSPRMARNEREKDFNGASVFDVYSVIDGRYVASFYIYDNERIKVNQIYIRNKKLYAIFHPKVVIYDFNSNPLTDQFESTRGVEGELQ
jgi:hypothetical protein